MANENEVGPSDRVTIIITGVMSTSGGRASRQVDYDSNLATFLETYGENTKSVAAPNMEALQKLAGQDPAQLQAKMAQLTKELIGAGAKSLPQRIVDATCKFLVEEKGFIIADSDPGTDKFYVSKGDLVPQVLPVPGDGNSWHVVAAAPFGA